MTQIQQRSRGEKITDRLVSLADPDARPIRKGKLGKPNEFGYVVQLAEVTANTGRGARGYVLPAASAPGNPGENRLLPQTVAELDRLGLTPREVALDGGFVPGPTIQTLAGLAPTRTFISGRAEPGSRRTRRRLARYRTGCEGRISHLKRGYGLRRSRLRGRPGPADLDRLGGPGLQPRHPRHPHRLSATPTTPHPAPRQAHSSQALTPARFSGGSNQRTATAVAETYVSRHLGSWRLLATSKVAARWPAVTRGLARDPAPLGYVGVPPASRLGRARTPDLGYPRECGCPTQPGGRSLAGLSTTEIGSPTASPATCSLDPASCDGLGLRRSRSPFYRAQAEESTLTRPKSMRPAPPSSSSCAGAKARRRNGCILREQGPRRSCSGCGPGTATLGAPLGGSGGLHREAESGKGDVHGYADPYVAGARRRIL